MPSFSKVKLDKFADLNLSLETHVYNFQHMFNFTNDFPFITLNAIFNNITKAMFGGRRDEGK
jgi:hypothetical protein